MIRRLFLGYDYVMGKGMTKEGKIRRKKAEMEGLTWKIARREEMYGFRQWKWKQKAKLEKARA